MGLSEIRVAAKVDLEKDAASQPQLHVSRALDGDDDETDQPVEQMAP